ncbi:MAG: RND family transporter [Isosphaeraceae bacterium]
MTRILLNARYLALVGSLVLLAWLMAYGGRVGYEQSINSFFADDDPVMATYQKAARSFGDDNFVFVVYDDPELFTTAGMDRVAELAQTLGPSNVEGVLRVESLDAMPLLWAIDDTLLALDRLPAFARRLALNTAKGAVKSMDLRSNAMSIGGAVRAAEGKPAALADLRAKATAHPLFQGTVVDRTGETTSVVVRLKKTTDHVVTQTIAELRERADAFASAQGMKPPSVVGPPVLLADGFRAVELDGRRLAVVGMLLIGLVTLSATQSLWWALVPLLSGWLVWMATEAILSAWNLKLAFSGGPLVAQIIVLTMPAASHLAIHFRDDSRNEANPREAARTTLRAVAVPIVWTAVTGAIGYGALVISDVVPIQQFGAILGTCTLIAALLVMAISPVAMLPPFRLEIAVRRGSCSMVTAPMNWTTGWVYRHPGVVVAVVCLTVIPVMVGIRNLVYETNYINLFRPNTRVVHDYHEVEARLGGIGLVSVVVPVGPTVDPAVIERFQSVNDEINAIRVSGRSGVSGVLSLATVLDPDGRIAALSPEAAARTIAAKLDLISVTPQAELLNGFWNPRTQEARLLVRLYEQQPAPDKQAIFDQSVAAARKTFGPESYLTGLSFLMTKTTEAVIVTQWQTFTWSAVGILLMLTLALRNPGLAILAILPTLLAVGLVLGLMGWLGVKLDMATALVASVALGLSVDDTFHCLLQFRRDRGTRPFADRLFTSYAVAGPGVILSSLAVAIGFAALRLSEFAPFANFGTMVGIATAGSTLGNLVLLPACLTLGDRLRSRFRQQPSPAVLAGDVSS